MKTKKYILLSILFLLITFPAIQVLADDTDATGGAPDILSDGPQTAEDLIGTKLTKYALGIAGTIAVVMIITSGFWMMTAGGNKDRYQKGVKMLTYSIVGLIVVIMSYVIIYVVARAIAG